jgi:hypothetical protein
VIPPCLSSWKNKNVQVKEELVFKKQKERKKEKGRSKRDRRLELNK